MIDFDRRPRPGPDPRAGRAWNVVRAEVGVTIAAPAARLVALYLDYTNWPRLFPARIDGARLLARTTDELIVEVDHRTAGRVVNVIRPRSQHEIQLEEFKPKYAATFVNRFEPLGPVTRYTVRAVVRLRLPYALLAPFLGPYVRRTVRRYVLDPVRAYAERVAPESRPRVRSSPRDAADHKRA